MTFPMLTPEQWKGVIRSGLLIVGTFLASAGIVEESAWQGIMGGVMNVIGIVWGIRSNSRSSILETAASDPKVREIVVDTQTQADEIPSAKVVSQ